MPTFIPPTGECWLQRESVHLSRFKFLKRSSVVRAHPAAQLRPDRAADPDRNQFRLPILPICSKCAARGEPRAARGRSASVGRRHVEFRYVGLDDVLGGPPAAVRPAPTVLGDGYARWDVDLDAEREQAIVIKTCCLIDDDRETIRTASPPPFGPATRSRRDWSRDSASISTAAIRSSTPSSPAPGPISTCW